jgi:hypothetical protein
MIMKNKHILIAAGVAAAIAGTMALALPKDSENENRGIAEAEAVTPMVMSAVFTESMSVPDGDTSFKSYMDYKCITDRNSPQYKLQGECWTDKNGLRRFGDDYVIAVGSYYAESVGERLEITLDSGDKFTAVVGDFKADSHTDSTHRYYPMSNGDKNVIEFIVDTGSLDKKAKRMGDISYVDGFEGNIESVTKTELFQEEM